MVAKEEEGSDGRGKGKWWGRERKRSERRGRKEVEGKCEQGK